MRRILPLLVASLVLTALSASAATVLFPKPLHLTREVVDPISGKTSRIEQYCLANRVVSIVGSRTVIADYDRSELTEIDRQHGTYSVTPFAAVAAARPHHNARRATTAADSAPAIESRGTDHRAGRSVDLYSADDATKHVHADIAIDHATDLSRDALDVLTGAAFPNDGDATSDLARAAARRPVTGTNASGAAAAESYGLPIEQTVRWQNGAQTLTATNRVTRVGDELAPADLLAIPPGARKVDSMVVRTPREAEQLDTLPGKARP